MKNNSSITVTVIIPTYNAANRLAAGLSALENQSFPKDEFEIIVVDDGSTDLTPDLVKKYKVRYQYQKNKGPASARNKGVELALGDIILFTDSDCTPDKNWIREMVAPFKDPEIVGVKGAYLTAQDSICARLAQIEFEERYALLLKNKYIDMVDTYSAGYRKDLFVLLGGFDTSFPVPNNEDTELSYKISLKGYRMVFNPKAVVWHSGHPDTLIKYMRLKFWRGYWRMVVYQKYASKMIKDSYTPQSLKFQILIAFQILSSFLLGIISLKWGLLFLGVGMVCFIMVSLSFIARAFNQGVWMGFMSPIFLFIRALSLGAGAVFKFLTCTNQKKN